MKNIKLKNILKSKNIKLGSILKNEKYIKI